MWGEHSCPPPLTLDLWEYQSTAGRPVLKQLPNHEVNIKSGQECLPHTISAVGAGFRLNPHR